MVSKKTMKADAKYYLDASARQYGFTSFKEMLKRAKELNIKNNQLLSCAIDGMVLIQKRWR